MTPGEEFLEAGFNSSMFCEWWHTHYLTAHPEDWQLPANPSPLRRMADASWNFYLYAEVLNEVTTAAHMRVAAGRCKHTLPEFADLADILSEENGG